MTSNNRARPVIGFFVGDVYGFGIELLALEIIDTNKDIELFHRSAEIKR